MQGRRFYFKLPPFVYSTVVFGAIFYGFNMISFDRSNQKKGSTTSQKKVFDTLELKNLLLGLSELGYFQTTPYLSAHPHPTPPPNIFSFPNKNYNIRWVMVWSNVYRIAILLFHKMFEFINFPNKKPLGIENCIN
jgi:hypothetical protein